MVVELTVHRLAAWCPDSSSEPTVLDRISLTCALEYDWVSWQSLWTTEKKKAQLTIPWLSLQIISWAKFLGEFGFSVVFLVCEMMKFSSLLNECGRRMVRRTKGKKKGHSRNQTMESVLCALKRGSSISKELSLGSHNGDVKESVASNATSC